MTHYTTIVVGGGQAGLSASYYLQQQDIDHVVLEKHTLTHTWRSHWRPCTSSPVTNISSPWRLRIKSEKLHVPRDLPNAMS